MLIDSKTNIVRMAEVDYFGTRDKYDRGYRPVRSMGVGGSPESMTAPSGDPLETESRLSSDGCF